MSDLAERIRELKAFQSHAGTDLHAMSEVIELAGVTLLHNAPTILGGLAALEALEKLKELPWSDDNAKWTTSDTDTLHDCLGVPRIDWSTFKPLELGEPKQ